MPNSFQEETLNKLRGKIASFSAFSKADKDFWLSRIELLPPEYAIFILELFDESPEEILRLNENVKKKEQVVATGDKQAWKDLLAEETAYLESKII